MKQQHKHRRGTDGVTKRAVLWNLITIGMEHVIQECATEMFSIHWKHGLINLGQGLSIRGCY